MKKLLIHTYADKRYEVYSDLWKFCINHEYPEYDCAVVTDPGFAPGREQPKYFGACMRYLLGESNNSIYEYSYITDIDMFIVRTDPTILDFHLADMTGCFSNARRGPGEPQGVDRLTGLHFMHRSWYEKTKQARRKYLDLLFDGKIGHVSIDDELMLAKIVTESGLELPPNKNLIKRHHGIHLGTVRDRSKFKGNRTSLQERSRAFRVRVTHKMARRWCGIMEEPEYKSILKSINDKQAKWELGEVERLCRQMANERVD